MEMIYIKLLNEGVNAWRPVAAEKISQDVFRIVEPQKSDEEWEFSSGKMVRCTTHMFADNKEGLVAIEEITKNSYI